MSHIIQDSGLEVIRKSAIDLGQNEYALRVEDDKFQFGAFGGLNTFHLRPYINLAATAGTPERYTESYTSGTGASSGYVDNNPGLEYRVQSGTDVGGYGVIRSKKVLAYRPGIGSIARFTARFTTPVANSIQRAGLFNIGNELTFGYDGTRFGILRRTGGRPEIRKISLTQRATSSQTVTVTLNGTAFGGIAVTNSSIEQNAYEIASSTFTGWTAYNIGSEIYFQAGSVNAKSGTYSVASTGNLAGTASQVIAGAAVSDNWIYQTDWNETTLTSATDPFILDHTKGNVYQVQFQYLGYGQIVFSIENPNTGKFLPVHKIQYANAYQTPSMDLPQFKLGIFAASAGSTTNLAVHSASMAGFHENSTDFPFKAHSAIGSVTSVGTTLTNILALKKTSFANNRLLIADVIMNNVTCAAEGTKPVEFEIRLNPTFATALTWASVDEDSPVVKTTGGGTITNGEPIFAMALGKSSNINIELAKLDLFLSTDDVVSICARATSGTSDITASATWSEV